MISSLEKPSTASKVGSKTIELPGMDIKVEGANEETMNKIRKQIEE